GGQGNNPPGLTSSNKTQRHSPQWRLAAQDLQGGRSVVREESEILRRNIIRADLGTRVEAPGFADSPLFIDQHGKSTLRENLSYPRVSRFATRSIQPTRRGETRCLGR